MAHFLTTGDVLINAELLTYASVVTDSEGLHVSLAFAQGNGPGNPGGEVRLSGPEARSVLRWLRARSEDIDRGSYTLDFESCPPVARPVARRA